MELCFEQKVPYFEKWLAWQENLCEDKIYICDERNKKWYTIQGVGKDVWLLIDGIKNFECIVQEISDLYNVDYYEIFNDIVEFIKSMCDVGLVRL